MKSIYSLFVLAAAAVVVTSCNPLDKTYKTLDENPVPVAATTINYTLAASDYKLLPSTSAPYSAGYFTGTDQANQYVPTIMNAKYPLAGNGSNATVTFNIATSTTQIKLADSVFTHVAYTLTNADYLLLPNNKFTDFSDAQVESWLPYAGNPTNAVGTSFGSPANNTLALLTFNYFANSTTTVQTYSYLYIGGAWKKIYTISADQYNAIGKGGKNNDFAATDAPNLQGYFNTFLKQDPSVAATAKVGDIQYVSYKYYGGSTANTFQRVMALQFDGNNWTTGSVTTTGSLPFSKANGVWAGDPTVYYQLTSADTKLMAADANIGTSTLRTNLGSYGDFESGWTQADIAKGIITDVLPVDFKTPKINVNYKITYLAYSGGDTPVVLTFVNDGTSWTWKQ